MRDTFGWLLFRVIGNSLKFPITQKGTNAPMMRIFFIYRDIDMENESVI